MIPMQNFKQVSLPDYVQISVTELRQLQAASAMLAALKKGNVHVWRGYKYALWLNENDPGIQAIRLGWEAGD